MDCANGSRSCQSAGPEQDDAKIHGRWKDKKGSEVWTCQSGPTCLQPWTLISHDRPVPAVNGKALHVAIAVNLLKQL